MGSVGQSVTTLLRDHDLVLKLKKGDKNSSVGSKPKLGSARFWLELLGKKARLGLARHILQKKLGSARLALSFKKPSYLEKQKMS